MAASNTYKETDHSDLNLLPSGPVPATTAAYCVSPSILLTVDRTFICWPDALISLLC